MTRGSAFRLHLTGLAALASLSPCTGAYAASGSSNTKTTTISAINIANTADLDFGTMLPGFAGGTVTVDAQTGARTSVGIVLAGGTVSTGKFIGAATAGRVVTVSSASSPAITLSRVGGGATMTINQLRISVDGGGAQPFGPNHTVGASGAILFSLGGRLNVAANQQEGVYIGSFSLTMDYQ